MKLLLINPKFPESFWSFTWAVDTVMGSVKTLNPPLGLATLAALTPDGWDIEIVDENVESLPLDPQADIIGICGMEIQFERQKDLCTYYKSKGHYVVVGGSYASLCPEMFETLADTVVAGEAEYIWKKFCVDFAAGAPQKLYRETGVVSLEDSPVPRFDLLKHRYYGSMNLQFSRGCPFQCEFCDIIVMFGRKPRMKSIAQIGAELDMLRKFGAYSVFFVDDNLIGNKKAAKELLRFLRDYQEEHRYRFDFGTEVSLDLAYDDELMDLCREANMKWVFIGIESPDVDSLKETHKLVNTRQDILSSVRTIYSHGIDVLAGFIIGFDNDTKDVFKKQYDFIVESGIQSAMIGLLMAIEKTPLYERLEREGRLRGRAFSADNSKLSTNIIPKNMTSEELIGGYSELHHSLLELGTIARRIRNKARYLNSAPFLYTGTAGQNIHSFLKLAFRIRKRWGMAGIWQVLRSMPFLKPRLFPLVIHDWVIGLSMRDYVERHFAREFDEEERLAAGYLGAIKETLNRYLRQGSLQIALHRKSNANPDVSFCMRGRLGREFFTHAARQLDSMLMNTRSSLTLRIEEFHSADLELLKDMLNRLSRYRDRIVIAADEQSRRIINIDSSLFNLALNG